MDYYAYHLAGVEWAPVCAANGLAVVHLGHDQAGVDLAPLLERAVHEVQKEADANGNGDDDVQFATFTRVHKELQDNDVAVISSMGDIIRRYPRAIWHGFPPTFSKVRLHGAAPRHRVNQWYATQSQHHVHFATMTEPELPDNLVVYWKPLP